MSLKTVQLSYERNESILFSDLDIHLHAGEGLLIYGPNGCGKTTLLRLLAGLIKPTQGDIVWQDHSIFHTLASYHQATHYLGHAHGIKNQLTARENLLYSQSLSGIQNPSACEQALKTVSLEAHATSMAQKLSAGQKRRLALGRLFTLSKPLWILDEPFTNLDREGQQWFSQILENHFATGGMAVLTSHQTLAIKRLRTLSLGAQYA